MNKFTKLFLIPVSLMVLTSCTDMEISTENTSDYDGTTILDTSEGETTLSTDSETSSQDSSNTEEGSSSDVSDESSCETSDETTDETTSESSDETTEETSSEEQTSEDDTSGDESSSDAVTEKVWSLVDDVETLVAGDEITFAVPGKKVSMSSVLASTKSASYFEPLDVEFSDDLTSLYSDNSLNLTVGQEGQYYTFANSDGELLGATAAKKLAWNSGVTTWKVEISENGQATITNSTSAYGFLQYNNSTPRFTTYTSKQNLVSIYRGKQAEPIYADSISIQGENSVQIGKSINLSILFNPVTTNQKSVVWSSSNPNIASVNDGVVSGLALGKTTINAKVSTETGYVEANYDVEVVAVKPDAMTILIYLCGADLESDYYAATDDISEMLAYSCPDNVNIVIQTGGASTWSTKYGVNANKSQRWVVNGKTLENVYTGNKVNMGTQAALESFLTWGLKEYPADRTGVILWNHGGGMGGVCFDELYSNDSLITREVAGAVKAAMEANNITDKLEWIGYDACLMSVADIATINADYFNYMVSAEETEAGEGWDYDAFLPTLFNNTSVETEVFLDKICETFITDTTNAYISSGGKASDNENTLAVLDLSKIPTLITEFEDVATKLNINSSTAFNKLVNIAKASLLFGGTTESDYSTTYAYLYGNVDLVSFFTNASKVFTSVSFSNLIAAGNDLVISNHYGGKYTSKTEYPCGVCVFLAKAINATYYTLQVAKNEYSISDTKLSTWRSINISYGSFYS